jgi:hypothetical protein
MHPGRPVRKAAVTKPVTKLYKGLDWGILADRLPEPNIFLSVRGGTTEVPHGHMDLMSFQVVTGREAMVSNLGVEEYLDTTFSPRRYELFETSPPAKNTILINGVGITRPSEVKTFAVKGKGITGFRIDASGAMGEMRDGPVARFCGRLLLMLESQAFLIVDQVDLPQFGRMESRLHTYTKVTARKTGALLKGKQEKVGLVYACNVPAALYTAVNAPTTPARGATMVRWCTADLHKSMTMATLMLPGKKTGSVKMTEARNGTIVQVKAGRLRKTIRLSRKLLLR